jgi:hypothetical protein
MAIKKRNDDEFIENLIAPISDIYQEANSKVISIMVNRIKQIGTLSPTDAGRLSIMLKNQDLAEIEKVLSDATKLSISQIDSIVEESASYNDDLSAELFKARNISENSFRSNSSLLAIAEQAKKSMVDDVVRLSNTTAFVVNGKVTDIGKTYNYAVNRAVFEVQQGLFDFNTAMRSTVKELADSGIRTVDFESGYSRRLDSSVRQNLSDGVRQLNANYRDMQGKRFGADGIELSAHGLCSPDHLPYQGKQYTNEEFERIQASLDRPFFTMNCKHSQFPIIIGISDTTYSDKELQQFQDNSNKEVAYTTRKKDADGNYIKKTLPRYQATQVQRNLETEIRKLKDYKNQIDILGDKTESNIIQKKITQKTKYYKSVSEQIGISPRMERTRIVK